eukprot:4165406-Pyramimonas_sp.AAC.1
MLMLPPTGGAAPAIWLPGRRRAPVPALVAPIHGAGSEPDVQCLAALVDRRVRLRQTVHQSPNDANGVGEDVELKERFDKINGGKLFANSQLLTTCQTTCNDTSQTREAPRRATWPGNKRRRDLKRPVEGVAESMQTLPIHILGKYQHFLPYCPQFDIHPQDAAARGIGTASNG